MPIPKKSKVTNGLTQQLAKDCNLCRHLISINLKQYKMKRIKILQFFAKKAISFSRTNTFTIYPSVVYFEIFGRLTIIQYK